MAKKVVTFQSDDKEVIASIEKMNAKLAQLEEKNRQLSEQSAKDRAKANSGFQQGVQHLATMAASYVSVAAAASLVTKELSTQLELQKKTADMQVNAAGSERDFLFNLGFASQSQQQQALSRLGQISKSTGVAITDLYAPAGAAVSAAGGDTDRAMRSVEEAARLTPHSAASIELLAGSFLDLARATESGKIEDSVQSFSALAQMSRVTDPAKVAANLVPAFIGVKGFGGSDEDTRALIASMTSGMADYRGEMAGTASIRLAQQLEEFLPEEDRFTFDSKGRKRLARPGTGLTSTTERIARLQEDAGLREQFLSSASFEAKALAPSRDLLTGGTNMAEQFAKFQAAKPGQGDLSEILGRTDLQKTADLSRRGNQMFIENMLGATERGRYAVVRKGVDDLFESLGYGNINRTGSYINSQLQSFHMSPEQMGIAQLQQAIGGEQNRQTFGLANKEQSDQSIAKLQEMIDLLKKVEGNQKGGNMNAQVEGR